MGIGARSTEAGEPLLAQRVLVAVPIAREDE